MTFLWVPGGLDCSNRKRVPAVFLRSLGYRSSAARLAAHPVGDQMRDLRVEKIAVAAVRIGPLLGAEQGIYPVGVVADIPHQPQADHAVEIVAQMSVQRRKVAACGDVDPMADIRGEAMRALLVAAFQAALHVIHAE